MSQLLLDLKAAGAAGDTLRVAEVATTVIATLSPSGKLAELAARADASKKLDDLQAIEKADEDAVAYLDREGFFDELEDDFARAVPALAPGIGAIGDWALPLLGELAGPLAPLLSYGLRIACKVALIALQSWAAARVKNAPPPTP